MTPAEWIATPWPRERGSPPWVGRIGRIVREVIVELAPECDDYNALAKNLSKALRRIDPQDERLFVTSMDTHDTIRARLILIFDELWRDSLQPGPVE